MFDKMTTTRNIPNNVSIFNTAQRNTGKKTYGI